jgi:hypothetical protein
MTERRRARKECDAGIAGWAPSLARGFLTRQTMGDT